MSVQYVKLGDVCAKDSSNIAQKDLKDCFGKYPVYGAGGYIQNVDFYHQEDEYIAIVKDGAGVGRAMILPAKSSVIGTMQYIIPDKNKVDMHYLYYAIINMELGKYFSGATIPHIYFKDYQKEIFKLPDLETQKKIADNLKNIDLIIAKKNKQIGLFNELVKSRFIEMFGDPVKNEKNLPLEQLSKIGILERGKSQYRPRNAPELLGGPYPLIQTGDVSNSNIYITTYSNTYSELGLKQSKLWEPGTLCITIAANIAQTAILTFKACFPDSVVGFIPNNNTNIIFIHYWFGFFQKVLEEQAPQVAQKNINLKILSELKVILPSIELQNEFADFVKQTDKSKLEIQKSLDKLEILKKSLMQQYFG